MMSTQIALQTTVSDLVDEYDTKCAAIDDEVTVFNGAYKRLQSAACVNGVDSEPVIDHAPHVCSKRLQKNLLRSGWKAIYSRLNIDLLATAKDKKLWEQTVASPPPLTIDNAIATFSDYLLRARFHILRGLAETFAGLDPAYKSHERVKIGVKGLPKRLILSYWGGSSVSHGYGQLRDLLKALRAVQGKPALTHMELEEFISFWRGEVIADAWSDAAGYHSGAFVERDGGLYHFYGGKSVAGDFNVADDVHGYGTWRRLVNPVQGVEIRIFSTAQTCHVIFSPDTLLTINRALAEFYGDVLPDAEEAGVKPRQSTDVSKDLQFYPTPTAVVETVLDGAGLLDRRTMRGSYCMTEPLRVLEPSCGDGRFLDAIAARGHTALGIEVHAGRAAGAKRKGHAVVCCNFLDHPPTPEFDLVVMNPPFCGRHYLKHVRHALKFLKPNGRLVAVLPASAWYDHKDLTGEWRDLPNASFSESGTNIQTGFLIMRAGK